MSGNGYVYFVGAGPGDPDLLTMRAATLLRDADVVLYDALVSDEILACVRRGAQRFCVGKRAGTPCIAQDEINRMLVALCRKNRRVVRLKSGDPAIFGRLAEEIAAVRTAGFAYEIVPGITTAFAAASCAGIPLTERGRARRVQFVTAHMRAGEALNLDWASLADPQCTLVFYMGRGAAKDIAYHLISHGLAAETPVLLMTDASRPSEESLVVPLAAMALGVEQLPSKAPLIAIIGDVVSGIPASQSVPRTRAAY